MTTTDATTTCYVCNDNASKRKLHNLCVAKIHDSWAVLGDGHAARVKAFKKAGFPRCSGIPGHGLADSKATAVYNKRIRS